MSLLTLDFPRGEADAAEAVRSTLLFGVAIQLALLAPSVIGYGFDDREIFGASVWAKPIKFQLSLSLMLLTLVLLAPLAAPTRTVRWTSLAVAAAATFEIAYITLQAARGRASHFNVETPVEATLYQAMGAGAMVLVGGCFLIGAAIWRAPLTPGREGLRQGAAIGLMLGALLTLITAGVLSSADGHWVGGVRSDADGLPLFGWSRTGGDLRAPHFFATHVMQALPLLGLAADRLAPRRAIPIVFAGAVISVLVVAATFVQARAGAPFLG